jgi:hypothetical protein
MTATAGAAPNEEVFQLDPDPTSKTFDLWSKIENGKETNLVKRRFEAHGKRITPSLNQQLREGVFQES